MKVDIPEISDLIEANTHYGHRIRFRNPKMAPYIFSKHNGYHIIDIVKTRKQIEIVTSYILDNFDANASILFVGTKSHAADIVEDCANRCGAHYVNKRWLGGLLTNWTTMQCCIRSLNRLKLISQDNLLERLRLPKKELASTQKQLTKLQNYFGGVESMQGLPDLVVIVGQQQELNALKECKKLNIPMITIVDTDCDPSLSDSKLVIPGNDDNPKSIALILNVLVSAFSQIKEKV